MRRVEGDVLGGLARSAARAFLTGLTGLAGLAGLAGLTGLVAAGPARAHDTWLAVGEQAARPASPSPVPSTGAPPLALALGTGEAYPGMRSPVPWRSVAQAACQVPGRPPQALAPWRQTAEALWLRADDAMALAPGALSCWAQTRPQTITLAPAEVAAYLDEVRAEPTVRAAWAAQQATGQPWREAFSKHARWERLGAPQALGHAAMASSTPSAPSATARAPSGMPFELVLVGEAPVPGAEVTVQAWRDGQPAAGLAVQALNATAPLGLWVRTDARGQARLRLPLAGDWLLRAHDLRPPNEPAAPWTGRFTSLAFTLAADPPPMPASSAAAAASP